MLLKHICMYRVFTLKKVFAFAFATNVHASWPLSKEQPILVLFYKAAVTYFICFRLGRTGLFRRCWATEQRDNWTTYRNSLWWHQWKDTHYAAVTSPWLASTRVKGHVRCTGPVIHARTHTLSLCLCLSIKYVDWMTRETSWSDTRGT